MASLPEKHSSPTFKERVRSELNKAVPLLLANITAVINAELDQNATLSGETKSTIKEALQSFDTSSFIRDTVGISLYLDEREDLDDAKEQTRKCLIRELIGETMREVVPFVEMEAYDTFTEKVGPMLLNDNLYRMEHGSQHVERVRVNSLTAARLLHHEVEATLDHFVGSGTNDEEKKAILEAVENLDMENFIRSYETENRSNSNLKQEEQEDTIKVALKMELVMELKKKYGEDSLPLGIQHFISTFMSDPYPRS